MVVQSTTREIQLFSPIKGHLCMEGFPLVLDIHMTTRINEHVRSQGFFNAAGAKWPSFVVALAFGS